MSLSEKLKTEIITAMKAKNSSRLTALKYLKSLLQNNTLSGNPQPEESVIMGHHKKMSKSLDMYSDPKSIEDLKKELIIIEEFIPKPMSDEEIGSLVGKHVSLGNMGAIMKAVRPEITGPFDGKKLSGLIKAKLSEVSNG